MFVENIGLLWSSMAVEGWWCGLVLAARELQQIKDQCFCCGGNLSSSSETTRRARSHQTGSGRWVSPVRSRVCQTAGSVVFWSQTAVWWRANPHNWRGFVFRSTIFGSSIFSRPVIRLLRSELCCSHGPNAAGNPAQQVLALLAVSTQP